MDAEDEISRIHHSAGRALRNDLKLWVMDSPLTQEFRSKGIQHPDDMYSIIMRSYFHFIRFEGIPLPEMIKEYRDYWRSNGQDPDHLIDE